MFPDVSVARDQVGVLVGRGGKRGEDMAGMSAGDSAAAASFSAVLGFGIWGSGDGDTSDVRGAGYTTLLSTPHEVPYETFQRCSFSLVLFFL